MKENIMNFKYGYGYPSLYLSRESKGQMENIQFVLDFKLDTVNCIF